MELDVIYNQDCIEGMKKLPDESIDSTKLKAKYPQIAAECVKVSNRKAYIKVSLKGGKKDA